MIQIDGVPESLTREQYLSLISGVGLDPKTLRSLEFRPDGVYAKVHARKVSGALRVDDERDDVVMHEVFIPVRDGDA